MMSQHTSGPWHDNQKADGTERQVIHNSVGKLIAVVPHAEDARLIAKAPKMYEMLLRIDKMGITPKQAELDAVVVRTRALLREIDQA